MCSLRSVRKKVIKIKTKTKCLLRTSTTVLFLCGFFFFLGEICRHMELHMKMFLFLKFIEVSIKKNQNTYLIFFVQWVAVHHSLINSDTYSSNLFPPHILGLKIHSSFSSVFSIQQSLPIPVKLLLHTPSFKVHYQIQDAWPKFCQL